jgi:RNA polymerase sigma-70 factor
MGEVTLDTAVVLRLHALAQAERWAVPLEAFAASLASSAARTFGGAPSSPGAVERYLASLHLQDLALACACMAGHDGAWEHFVREHRPVLYRAADAIDKTGGARELADALYGELFGLSESHGERRSLFRYFHGRSTLATWLRAVLAQRYVDRLRGARRLEPLPEDDHAGAIPVAAAPPDADRERFVAIMRGAVAVAVGRLAPRDRLRLGCYYAQGLTLAEIGRALGEHEATVSRHVARTRRAIREDVERQLAHEHGMHDDEIGECFSSVVADAGSLDLAQLLGSTHVRKELGPERST